MAFDFDNIKDDVDSRLISTMPINIVFETAKNIDEIKNWDEIKDIFLQHYVLRAELHGKKNHKKCYIHLWFKSFDHMDQFFSFYNLAVHSSQYISQFWNICAFTNNMIIDCHDNTLSDIILRHTTLYQNFICKITLKNLKADKLTAYTNGGIIKFRNASICKLNYIKKSNVKLNDEPNAIQNDSNKVYIPLIDYTYEF